MTEKSGGVDDEVQKFKDRSVLAVCWAGSDRSAYMEEKLNERGWFATHRGVLDGNNYVIKEDLDFIGSIIFASEHERKKFEERSELVEKVKKNGIKVYTINVTQSDDDRAHRAESLDPFKEEIGRQLDEIGFKQYNDNADGEKI